jgi:hypothetical protein
VYYCQPEEVVIPVDENGNRTGEKITVYSAATAFDANVSAARGTADLELFGTSDMYDKVLVTTDISCPITENTVLFVDKPVGFTQITVNVKSDGDIVTRMFLQPLYDYVVVRVAKSINSISYALRKIPISGIPVIPPVETPGVTE